MKQRNAIIYYVAEISPQLQSGEEWKERLLGDHIEAGVV